jgi:hypothetical protein
MLPNNYETYCDPRLNFAQVRARARVRGRVRVGVGDLLRPPPQVRAVHKYAKPASHQLVRSRRITATMPRPPSQSLTA